MRYVFILIFFAKILFAGANLVVDSTEVISGDNVVFTIKADGENVTFPTISEIDGFFVNESGKSQNVQVINGKVTKDTSYMYSFNPTKDVIIPSYDVVVDGKTYRTKPVKIKITKKQSIPKDNFSIEISVSKDELYVGEQVDINITFKRNLSIEIMDLKYDEPNFKNLWTKQIGQERQRRDGKYLLYELNYVAFPQNSGEIELGPAMMRVAVPKKGRDIFGFYVKQPKWQNAISNSVKLKVKDVPQGVNLVGNFKIDVKVDKRETEPNAPVNATVVISGEGNIDDIRGIEIKIPEAMVYSDEAVKSFEYKNGTYQGNYKRTYAIVSDKSYIITPVEIKFFDPKDGAIKVAKSEPIAISVKGSKPKESQIQTSLGVQNSIDKSSSSESKNLAIKDKIIFFILGFVWGGFFVFLLFKFAKPKRAVVSRENKDPMIKLKDAKSDKEILLALLELKDDEDIALIIRDVESAIYGKKSQKINKNDILSKIKKIEKDREEAKWERLV